MTYPTAAGALLGRFPSGLTAGVAALPCDGRSALGGGLGQEALALSPSTLVRMDGPGASCDMLTQAGLTTRPESSPTVRLGGARGQAAPALSPLRRSPGGESGQAAQTHMAPRLPAVDAGSSSAFSGLSVGGGAGGPTPNGATKEAVIAFGGIPDPVSEG